MRKPFVVLRTRGAGWDDARPLEEQAEWPAHAAFMDALAAEGLVAFAGPLEGTRDALIVFHAEDITEVLERLSADPWTLNDLLVTKQYWPWQLRLGSLG